MPASESLFNEDAYLQPATLSRKRVRHWCFFVNFAKFLQYVFLNNPLGDCYSENSEFHYYC